MVTSCQVTFKVEFAINGQLKNPFFDLHYRYLIKTRMDGSGGQSVAYLIGSNLPDNKAVDLSLDGIIHLFQRVAAG